MGLNVCPAAIVAAPVDTVWELLADPLRYSEWSDGHVESVVPEGLISVGQSFYVISKALGRTWSVSMSVEKVNEQKHQLGIYVVFPLGLQLRQHTSCTPIDANSCRVQYG